MGVVYNFLGLSVGLIAHGLDFAARKTAYAADITYGTNNEFGFDYLRDNMVLYEDQMVQRPFNYAIIDEVDSILIDEARAPLIISDKVSSLPSCIINCPDRCRDLNQEETTRWMKARTVAAERGIAKVNVCWAWTIIARYRRR